MVTPLIAGAELAQLVEPCPRQTPETQASPTVQLLPSLQLDTRLSCQQPAVASQKSSVQLLLSLQFGAALRRQVPAEQVSLPLQALPSLQDEPLGRTVCRQLTPTIRSVVQGLPSSQSGGSMSGGKA